MMKPGRHFGRAAVAFLTVFFTGLLVYQHIPTSLDQLWQPFAQATLSALALYGTSRKTTKGA